MYQYPYSTAQLIFVTFVSLINCNHSDFNAGFYLTTLQPLAGTPTQPGRPTPPNRSLPTPWSGRSLLTLWYGPWRRLWPACQSGETHPLTRPQCLWPSPHSVASVNGVPHVSCQSVFILGYFWLHTNNDHKFVHTCTVYLQYNKLSQKTAVPSSDFAIA